jgi:hypothetical protein
LTETTVDDRYYEAVSKSRISERLLVLARNRIYADFLRLCAPRAEDPILDVGVSDVIAPGANLLERLYPHPERLTAVGLGIGGEFRAAFPKIAYRRIAANQPLPFADGVFAVAASNAVLEHVGSPEHQRAFVAEMARVARKAFITVPHRYFPVEPHTNIPLLHFGDTTFAAACRALGKAEWASQENLILMDRARLASLIPPGCKATIGATGLPLGPFSSNLYLYLER